jgi:hypothetical protein
LNATSVLVNGSAISGSKWTTSGTNISYTTGNVAIGTTDPGTYKLNVAGDVSITGDYRKGTALYKPAGAVLADTATALATARTIAGTSFNGTENINLNYFSITNIPIILIPTTTNLQVDSTKNLIVGTVASGTIERLSVGGNIRATGTITADTNLTATGTSTLTGRVGIAKAPHATYACDVNGTLNATSVLVGGTAITGSKWTGTTGIYSASSSIFASWQNTILIVIGIAVGMYLVNFVWKVSYK